MRPLKSTGAHATEDLAELVCSNSLGSTLPYRASGLLKQELARLGSMLLECARGTGVPAGTALAVDRVRFAQAVTARVETHRRIRVVREEVKRIPDGLCIVASGPLTSEALAQSIAERTGEERLFFFDAIAPIVAADTIEMSVAFRGSRLRHGQTPDNDYINCPLDQSEYDTFVDALVGAERMPLRDLELDILGGVRAGTYFEGCLPVEVLAQRGHETLAFGPMRPIGLIDPRTGRRPFAVVQLRQDNLAGTLYNMVGFQTNLKYGEQKRVFRLIPGMQHADFARYGQMHRNTYISSPLVLRPTLQNRDREDLFFAGQIMGVEGYMGNIATGLLAGINASRLAHGDEPWVLPPTTMIGGLCHYVTHADLRDFQPMKANYGILPPLEPLVRGSKVERGRAYTERATAALEQYVALAPV
jgi:methylenetetrahydrofolate--tRNA-(uracil-5-)-methyltransferase